MPVRNCETIYWVYIPTEKSQMVFQNIFTHMVFLQLCAWVPVMTGCCLGHVVSAFLGGWDVPVCLWAWLTHTWHLWPCLFKSVARVHWWFAYLMLRVDASSLTLCCSCNWNASHCMAWFSVQLAVSYLHSCCKREEVNPLISLYRAVPCWQIWELPCHLAHDNPFFV